MKDYAIVVKTSEGYDFDFLHCIASKKIDDITLQVETVDGEVLLIQKLTLDKFQILQQA